MPVSNPSRIAFLAALTVLMTAPSYTALAQSAPDAGQALRDVRRQDMSLPKKSVPLVVDGAADEAGEEESSIQIPVSQIVITGNTVYPAQRLHTLVQDLEGGTHTLADLNAGARRITDFYKQHGYLVARAYIPAQEIEDGRLTIAVLEGNLDSYRLQNNSRLPDDRAARYVANQIGEGDIMRSEPIDRSLLLLADTPGVGGARADLRPGQSVGTSELVVNLDAAEPYTGYLAFNNFGNRYTGEYQLDGGVSMNSPLNIGDQLSLRLLASNESLYYGRIAYQVPVGYDGLRVGAAYAVTSYELAKEFESLDAHGTAKSASVYAIYPFLRSLTSNVYGTFTLEDKRLKDRTGTPYSASDKSVQLARLGFSGNHQDDVLGGGITTGEISLVAGDLDLDSASLVIDDATAQTDGTFGRLTYDVSRLQRITDTNFAFARLSGQAATKNLNSSEEISLGGVNGVRAYPLGEGDGDEGWVANLELRQTLPSTKLTPSAHHFRRRDRFECGADRRIRGHDIRRMAHQRRRPAIRQRRSRAPDMVPALQIVLITG